MPPPSQPPRASQEKTRPLTALRCLRHPTREAVARCPECGQVFCRECISEHAGRVLCGNCLAEQIARESKGTRPAHNYAWLRSTFKTGVSALALWLGLYLLGKVLVMIPANFHEGTLWKSAIERSQSSTP